MWAKVAQYFSRKFVLAGLALAGSFILAYTAVEMGGWVGAITAILAFYNGSNVYQEYLASKRVSTTEENKQ